MVKKDGFDRYLELITPKLGDSTYTLLKAHLIFEELLHAYLAKTLPHSNALTGARLTFAQLLAVARASSHRVQPDNWIWKAIGDLNKLRNMLSHEVSPASLAKRIDAYTVFVASNTRPLPLPLPTEIDGALIASGKAEGVPNFV